MSPLGLIGILQLKVTLVLVEVEVKLRGAVGTIKINQSEHNLFRLLLSCTVVKEHCVGGP